MPPACFDTAATSQTLSLPRRRPKPPPPRSWCSVTFSFGRPSSAATAVDRGLRRLRRRPDLDAVALEPGRAVLRLEVRVRHVVDRIHRLDRLAGLERRLDVAALAERLRRGPGGDLLRLGDRAGPAVVRRFGLVPLDLELLLRLERGPGRIREDRYARQTRPRRRRRTSIGSPWWPTMNASFTPGSFLISSRFAHIDPRPDLRRLRERRVHHARHRAGRCRTAAGP